jgi:hypothetical protein
VVVTEAAQETAWQRYGIALKNGRLLLAGLAIGFQNTVRYGSAHLGARVFSWRGFQG